MFTKSVLIESWRLIVNKTRTKVMAEVQHRTRQHNHKCCMLPLFQVYCCSCSQCIILETSSWPLSKWFSIQRKGPELHVHVHVHACMLYVHNSPRFSAYKSLNICCPDIPPWTNIVLPTTATIWPCLGEGGVPDVEGVVHSPLAGSAKYNRYT